MKWKAFQITLLILLFSTVLAVGQGICQILKVLHMAAKQIMEGLEDKIGSTHKELPELKKKSNKTTKKQRDKTLKS